MKWKKIKDLEEEDKKRHIKELEELKRVDFRLKKESQKESKLQEESYRCEMEIIKQENEKRQKQFEAEMQELNEKNINNEMQHNKEWNK